MATRHKKMKILIDEPFIDDELKIKEGFEKYVNYIKSHTDRSYDDLQHTHLHIVVKDREMLPTAVYFSFSEKLNISVRIDVHDFPGADVLYSYLVRSVVGEVNWRGA